MKIVKRTTLERWGSVGAAAVICGFFGLVYSLVLIPWCGWWSALTASSMVSSLIWGEIMMHRCGKILNVIRRHTKYVAKQPPPPQPLIQPLPIILRVLEV